MISVKNFTRPSFVEEVVPESKVGNTTRGEGVWQCLIRDFLDSGVDSARIELGGRDFKNVYTSVMNTVRMDGYREKVKVVQRAGTQSVYLKRVS